MLSFEPTSREKKYINQKNKALEDLKKEKKKSRDKEFEYQRKIKDLTRRLNAVKSRNKKINNRNKSLLFMLRRERKYREKIPKLAYRSYRNVLNNLTCINLSLAYLVGQMAFKKIGLSQKEATVLLMCYRFDYLKADTMRKAYPILISNTKTTKPTLVKLRKRGFIDKEGKDIYFITHKGVIFVEKLATLIMHYTRKHGVGFRTEHISNEKGRYLRSNVSDTSGAGQKEN